MISWLKAFWRTHLWCEPPSTRRPWLVDRDGRIYPDKGRVIELRGRKS